MSEVEQYEETVDPAVPVPAVVDMTPMMQWAAESRQVAIVAVSLAKTSFVPKAFQGKPAEVTAAILAGNEMGMQPMAALRSINVIQGMPSLSAVAMRGLVQSHGHKIWIVESSKTRAVVRGQRRGEDEVHESKWTIDRAHGLGLLSKDNWQKQPEAMLIARATAECARFTAADVLVGMPYSTEELTDLADGEEPPRRRTAKRKPVTPVEVPEPELLEETPTTEEPEPAGDRDE